MKVSLLSVGKTDDALFAQLIEEYRKRVNFYIPFEMTIVPDLKNRKNISEKEQKTLEGNLLLKSLQPGDHVILLDDKGEQYTSVEFARYIEKRATQFPNDWFLWWGDPTASHRRYTRLQTKSCHFQK